MIDKNEHVLRLIVGVDFSDRSRTALRKAFDLCCRTGNRLKSQSFMLLTLRFAQECVEMSLFAEGDIKKRLFLNAKARLKTMLEEFAGRKVQSVVCEGMLYPGN